MLTLRAIIIDDELTSVESLNLLLKNFFPEVKIIANVTSAQEGIMLIENHKPDVVFLDMQMPFLDGFELLNKIEHKDFSLVFTTELALPALKNNLLDFLIKPVEMHALKTVISKVKKNKKSVKIENSNWKQAIIQNIDKSNQLEINAMDETIYEPFENIMRLESDSNYTVIYLADKRRYTVPKLLKDYENILCQHKFRFMRVHNSHIINLNYVQRFVKEGQGQVVMTDDTAINLSKAKRVEFLSWLGI